MYLLYESPAGYALFNCDSNKGSTPEAVNSIFACPSSSIKKVPMTLKAFCKFETTTDALREASQLIEGKLTDSLKKFLKKEIKKSSESLGVADTKLAKAIAKKLEIPLISDQALVGEWTRGARAYLPSFLSDESGALGTMALGLAHSLSRFKLKFSSDRIDSMVIQAIALLDDLDKELNTYAMRLREWYGWHFPELSNVLTDSLAYARLIRLVGRRDAIASTSLAELLPEDLETKIKSLSSLSMGTELTDPDLEHIQQLANQVISLSEYRAELSSYLQSRMEALAPNLTALLGELVGARLIAHSGSLVGLAKQPASTIQLLGAEKALFRALKTRSPTPKYGLLFHTSLVGQAGARTKGKIARALAAKAALSIRIDALSRTEETNVSPDASFGIASRLRVEQRLTALERQLANNADFGAAISSTTKKYTFVSPESSTASYNPQTDLVALSASSKRKLVEELPDAESTEKKEKKKSKDKDKPKKHKQKE